MDTHRAAVGTRSLFSLKKWSRRLEDLKGEFFRIEWTEGRDVLTYTKVVIVATFVSGMVLYIADLVVHRALLGIEAILRAIFG